MSIKLDSLIIENFNSYLGSHKISFTENQGNLVLIKGVDEFDKSSNGVGKSTIVDAIVFALYGRSLKKELNLDDLVCKKSTEPLKIVLSFIDSSDGVIKNSYVVERLRSTKPIFSKCILYEDEVCISNSMTNSEVQTKIESLMGMDYQMFVNNNVLNPELFRFVKGNSAQKIDILERVLNLNIVSKIFFTLSNVVKEDSAVYTKNDTEYYALKKSLDSLIQQEESVNKNVNENIDLLTVANLKLVNEIEEQTERRNAYSLIVSELHPVVEQLSRELDIMNESKIKLEHNIAEHQKKVKYYEKHEDCHACKQPIQNRDTILREERAKIKEHAATMTALMYRMEQSKANEDISKYESAVSAADECTRLISEKSYQIRNNNKNIERFSSITSAVDQVEEVKAKMQTAFIEWEDSKSKFEITDFWRDMLVPKSKTRMTLAADLLKVLNANIQKHINNFYNKDFHLHFSINDNSIMEIIEIEGRQFKYDQLSSGEKAKVDIVIVISLLDIAMTYFKNNKLKFLIVDEACDHLDLVWSKYVIEFIKQYAVNLNMMVLFISHHAAVEDMTYVFDNTITAMKGLDGNSYISKTRIH
jgi:DNA repair exonuclease SbcCD ATPase subunit